MRKMSILMTVFALSAACSADPSKGLEGKWQGATMNEASAAAAPEAVAWATGVSFEFKGDKMTVAVPAEEPRSGKFKVQSAKKNTVVLAVAGEGDEPERVKVQLKGEKQLVWQMGGDRELVFNRID